MKKILAFTMMIVLASTFAIAAEKGGGSGPAAEQKLMEKLHGCLPVCSIFQKTNFKDLPKSEQRVFLRGGK